MKYDIDGIVISFDAFMCARKGKTSEKKVCLAGMTFPEMNRKQTSHLHMKMNNTAPTKNNAYIMARGYTS